MDGRIVIPQALRRDVLRELHASHMGLESTKRRARQLVYWPGLSSDIENVISSCVPCAERQPSQPRQPLLQRPLPQLPFQHAAVDLFSFAGKQYLVYVCSLSGWPEVKFWKHSPTSAEVMAALKTIFVSLGVPSLLQSDNGPQFSALAFKQFAEVWKFNHVTSSPHNPMSNGLAENAVKRIKNLVAKTSADIHGDPFLRGLLELRNTPSKASGQSPAQILFGHPIRSLVPINQRAFAPKLQRLRDLVDKLAIRRAKVKDQYDQRAHPLRPLTLGSRVRIQDPVTSRWNRTGTVVERRRGRSYLITTPSGKTFQRTRAVLRPVTQSTVDSFGDKELTGVNMCDKQSVSAPLPHEETAATTSSSPSAPKPPPSPQPRPRRQRRQPLRLRDFIVG